MSAVAAPEQTIAPAGAGRLVFLFPDGEAPPAEATAELLASEPVFRRAMEMSTRVVRDLLGVDLTSRQPAAANAGPLTGNDPGAGQCALVAFELAYANLWESRGVHATGAVGFGVGEIAAAVHSGLLALEDGLHLAAARGRLTATTLATVDLTASPRQAAELIGDLDIAPIEVLGPCRTTVAGVAHEVPALLRRAEEREVRAVCGALRRITCPRAAETGTNELTWLAQRVSHRRPHLDFAAVCAGGDALTDTPAQFWRRHLQPPADLYAAAKLLTGGCPHARILELGQRDARTAALGGEHRHRRSPGADPAARAVRVLHQRPGHRRPRRRGPRRRQHAPGSPPILANSPLRRQAL